MIIPPGKEYIATKKIVQGKASMPEEFIPLANYIDSTFKVKTLNIIKDTINYGQTERLRICLETEDEEKIFHVDGLFTNYDPEKQRLIAEKYKQIKRESQNQAL
ncbi:hypothetical protein LRS05_08955 [Flavobacterium sp. J372]|uniref:hypothetical protein n=1 Tax=Flavobacterium sp. J372 TaxID=2898436 RepID=UPI002150D1B1|nr:hypothetical protein [Flavobacterium sp. J372]MCR5862266.1 hypothetical protein [Flavobacterium sp. J372]